MKKLLFISLFLGLVLYYSSLNAQDGYFQTSDGVNIHYIEAGAGETLIFVTGWKMPAEIWIHQIEYFSENYHVIAMDPRSQGRSELVLQDNTLERRAKDIFELIKHLNVQPISVIGWSGGMWEILSMLDQFESDNVKSVVLVDYTMERAVDLDRLNWAMSVWGDHQRDPYKTTEQFVRGCFKTSQPESFIKKIIDLSLKTPGSIAFAIGANLILFNRDWWPVFEENDLPVFYAVSERYSGIADEFKKRIPNAKVEVFKESGHALFVDESDRFNNHLSDFITNILD